MRRIYYWSIWLAAISASNAIAVTNLNSRSETTAVNGTLDYEQDLAWSFGLKSGLAKFDTDFIEGAAETAGLEVQESDSITNLTAELVWFNRKNLGLNIGHRFVMATAGSKPRATYQATYVGLTYFPLTLGIPIVARRNFNTITYNFKWKPYVFAGGSLGHAIVATFFDGATDVSSEFWGMNGGGGIQWEIGKRTAVDFGATIERAVGFSPAIAYVSNNMFAQFGIHFYF